MSTIKDVAQLANVSISTVSYALNNSGSVSGETKKKVLEAAKKLDYKPNGIARSLKTKKTEMIGVFLNDFNGPVYSEIIRGVQEIAVSKGYEIIIAECMANEHSVSRIFTQGIVDGAIVLSTRISSDIIREYASSHFPVVLLDREMSGEYISSVLIDNKSACYNLVKYIKDLGYRKVAIINGPKGTYDSNKRYEGMTEAIRDFGLTINEGQSFIGKFTEDDGYRFGKEIAASGNLPEVILAANDEMAIGAMKALQEEGISVPDQVSVTGFDDIELCQYVSPKLTTIARPAYELGLLATHVLFNSMKGDVSRHSQVLNTELVIRESLRITK